MAPVLGVATVALGVSVADAKMVRYEVNGQRFSSRPKTAHNSSLPVSG
jgi:hypothetical protein